MFSTSHLTKMSQSEQQGSASCPIDLTSEDSFEYSSVIKKAKREKANDVKRVKGNDNEGIDGRFQNMEAALLYTKELAEKIASETKAINTRLDKLERWQAQRDERMIGIHSNEKSALETLHNLESWQAKQDQGMIEIDSVKVDAFEKHTQSSGISEEQQLDKSVDSEDYFEPEKGECLLAKDVQEILDTEIPKDVVFDDNLQTLGIFCEPQNEERVDLEEHLQFTGEQDTEKKVETENIFQPAEVSGEQEMLKQGDFEKVFLASVDEQEAASME